MKLRPYTAARSATAAAPSERAERDDAISLDPELLEEESPCVQVPLQADEVDDDDAETLRQAVEIPRALSSLTSVRPPSPVSRPLPPPPRVPTPTPGRTPLPPVAPSKAPPRSRPTPPLAAARDEAGLGAVTPSGGIDVDPFRALASESRLETPQMMASALPPRSSSTEPPSPGARRGSALAVVGVVGLMLLVGAGGFALGTGYQSRAVVHVVASEMRTREIAEPEPKPAEAAAPSEAKAAVATGLSSSTAPVQATAPKVAMAPKPIAPKPAIAVAAKPASPEPPTHVAAAENPNANPSLGGGSPPAHDSPKTSAVTAPDDPTYGVTSAGF